MTYFQPPTLHPVLLAIVSLYKDTVIWLVVHLKPLKVSLMIQTTTETLEVAFFKKQLQKRVSSAQTCVMTTWKIMNNIHN